MSSTQTQPSSAAWLSMIGMAVKMPTAAKVRLVVEGRPVQSAKEIKALTVTDEEDRSGSAKKLQDEERAKLIKALRAARKKEWRAANKEHIAAYNRAYREKNKARVQQHDRDRWPERDDADRAVRNAYYAAYYAERKELLQAKSREYYARNKDKVRARQKARYEAQRIAAGVAA